MRLRSDQQPMAKTLVTGAQRLPRLASRARLADRGDDLRLLFAPHVEDLATWTGSSSSRPPATSPTGGPSAARWRASTGSSTSPGAPRCARPTAMSSSTPTFAAPGSCSRRRCAPASSASSTPRPPPRSARPSRARPPTKRQQFRAGHLGIAYVNSKHEAEVEALRARRPRAAGRDRQPDLRARPRRSDRDLDESRAQLPASGRSPPTSTAASTSSTCATSPTGTCPQTSAAQVGERYILGGRNFTLDRLFADLARISGVDAARR